MQYKKSSISMLKYSSFVLLAHMLKCWYSHISMVQKCNHSANTQYVITPKIGDIMESSELSPRVPPRTPPHKPPQSRHVRAYINMYIYVAVIRIKCNQAHAPHSYHNRRAHAHTLTERAAASWPFIRTMWAIWSQLIQPLMCRLWIGALLLT